MATLEKDYQDLAWAWIDCLSWMDQCIDPHTQGRDHQLQMIANESVRENLRDMLTETHLGVKTKQWFFMSSPVYAIQDYMIKQVVGADRSLMFSSSLDNEDDRLETIRRLWDHRLIVIQRLVAHLPWRDRVYYHTFYTYPVSTTVTGLAVGLTLGAYGLCKWATYRRVELV